MKQFLDVYGALPEVIGGFDLDTNNAEMCFIQYLPIKISMSKSHHAIPDNLKCYEWLVQNAVYSELLRGVNHKYIYLTVKRIYGTGNREGWHCDGFGTDDINYIWYDSHPTQFFDGEMILPHSHTDSIIFMENNIGDPDDKVMYPCNTLIRMTQSSIHRVNPELFTGLRTFVKISFSDSKYNLKGNAHNYLLDYEWEMYERKIDRNDPIGVYT